MGRLHEPGEEPDAVAAQGVHVFDEGLSVLAPQQIPDLLRGARCQEVGDDGWTLVVRGRTRGGIAPVGVMNHRLDVVGCS